MSKPFGLDGLLAGPPFVLRMCFTVWVEYPCITAAEMSRSTYVLEHRLIVYSATRSLVRSIFEHAIKGRWITGPNPATAAPYPEMVRKETQVLTLIQTKQVLAKMRYPEKEMARP